MRNPLSPLPRVQLHVETLLALGVAAIVGMANMPLWRSLIEQHAGDVAAGCRSVLLIFCAISTLHFAVFGLVATRRTIRPLLTGMILLAGASSYYVHRYGVVIDTGMLRNVLHTDWREASELLNASFLVLMCALAIPVAAVWRVELLSRRQAVAKRAIWLTAALSLAMATLLLGFQDFSSLMRTQKNLRYTVAPGNVIWSSARLAVGSSRNAIKQREPAEPAQRILPVAGSRKPVLLVMVVGETARAANFSLNGYPRDTNPELAHLSVINYPNATSCGTSTEVSLPCMFSPFGRADYDEDRIRNHESLLHLLARAGFQVSWLDNQSGCKGVCDGLHFIDVSRDKTPGLCADGHCFDEVLLDRMKTVAADSRDRVVVLHQLGNHGPAYARRYPADFGRFGPACEGSDLGNCTREEIVNAYDNAIAYTDHVLARTIAWLKSQQDRYDVALVYVSDHGESLGEHGLFLHGVPYAIAPGEQTRIPMLWWLPPETASAFQVDTACLGARAGNPVSHDNLFSSILGLLHVQTPRYRADRDLFAPCRVLRYVGNAPDRPA